jgi:hypothetical protein
MHSAIKMLNLRIEAITQYLEGVCGSTAPPDHALLRQIASLTRQLPAVDTPNFQQNFLTVRGCPFRTVVGPPLAARLDWRLSRGLAGSARFGSRCDWARSLRAVARVEGEMAPRAWVGWSDAEERGVRGNGDTLAGRQEYNDAVLMVYLACMTKGASGINELADKFNVAYDKHSRRKNLL